MDGSAIRDLILQSIADTPDYPSTTPYRMSATGHCLRQRWYKWQSPGEDRPNAESRWEMDDGNLHEEELRQRFRRAGFTIERVQEEVVLRTRSGEAVVGHIDGVVSWPEMGLEPCLWESKAMSYIRFGKAVKQGIAVANPDYYDQVQLYMAGLNLWRTVFVIKAKDSSATKQQLRGWDTKSRKLDVQIITRDDEAVEQAMERHDLLQSYIDSHVEPPRGHKRSDWQCDYCPFVKECWNE